MALPLHPRASACGKVILLGEHAVVHAVPALAAGLPGGLELAATALPAPTGPLQLSIPSWDLDLLVTPDNEHPVARAAAETLTHCDGPLTGYRIEGSTTLPSRAGLGSSAALTVALARLVLGPDADLGEVVAASIAGERVFHGEPSGIDSQVAARGGVIRFVRGHEPTPITLATPLPLVILPSGIPRNTADQVAAVGRMVRELPEVARPTLDAIAACVAQGEHALKSGDLSLLGRMFSISHELLSALGVSIGRLDEMCSTALEAGALGAKLTGAGKGGCAIALADPADPVLDAMRNIGIAGAFATVVHNPPT